MPQQPKPRNPSTQFLRLSPMAVEDDVKKLLATQDEIAEQFRTPVEEQLARHMESLLGFSTDHGILREQTVRVLADLWDEASINTGAIMLRDILDGRKAEADQLARIALEYLHNYGLSRH